MISNKYFKQAKPVWLKDKENEMNCGLELECALSGGQNARLIITGATFYQVYCGGELLHYGPARKAHGYSGVDEVIIPKTVGKARIAIRVMGYNCKCFSIAKNSSFVQAELICDGEIIAATGGDGFVAYELSSRLQKVMRYSYQRPFSECWDYTRDKKTGEIAVTKPEVKYIGRNVPYCSFDVKSAQKTADMEYVLGEEYRMPLFPYITEPKDEFECFKDGEIEAKPYCEYLRTCSVDKGEGALQKWDFKQIQTGFFRMKLKAAEESRIILAFAEQLDVDGRPSMKPLNSVNVIEIRVPAGEHTFVSFEPYTVRYAEILTMNGDVGIDELQVLELAYPKDKIVPFHTDDAELMEIYDAAVDTFRHNSFDIFMDCPSRERAGWLFDSYYTAKSERAFTGESVIEDEFLNNYRLGAARCDLNGMVDMCYPGDVFSGTFIPQWSMWYILELHEYFTKRGREGKKKLFKEQIMTQVKYFEEYENEFGLLERLDGWNFVEWSALNQRVYDVSWPTNMLYCAFLAKVGELYEIDELIEKSKQIKAVVCEMAFDGKLFCDRAVRDENGELANTDERSETTQYYALYFDIADINNAKCSVIKDILMGNAKLHDIEPADAMPGLYLRTELLLEYKEYEYVKESIKEYFAPMAKESGTLWERKSGMTSRDHGFASFIGAAIKQVV